MAISKVTYDGRDLIDLTSDTVSADNLLSGVTAHAKNGEQIVGTLSYEDDIEELRTEIDNKQDKLSLPLSIENGGTGNNAGLAASATKLDTARTIRTNLASTSAASFDGSSNITPGVTGALPISNGGTGSTSASGARNALGAMSETATSLGLTANSNLANYSASVNNSLRIGNLLLLNCCIILSTDTVWSSEELTLFTINSSDNYPSTERTALRSVMLISGTGGTVRLRGLKVNTNGQIRYYNNLGDSVSNITLIYISGIYIRL